MSENQNLAFFTDKLNISSFFCFSAQFDLTPQGKGELGFKRGDILHVTETLYEGQLGVWRASLVHDESTTKSPSNTKSLKGKIPSKRKYVNTRDS